MLPAKHRHTAGPCYQENCSTPSASSEDTCCGRQSFGHSPAIWSRCTEHWTSVALLSAHCFHGHSAASARAIAASGQSHDQVPRASKIGAIVRVLSILMRTRCQTVAVEHILWYYSSHLSSALQRQNMAPRSRTKSIYEPIFQ